MRLIKDTQKPKDVKTDRVYTMKEIAIINEQKKIKKGAEKNDGKRT